MILDSSCQLPFGLRPVGEASAFRHKRDRRCHPVAVEFVVPPDIDAVAFARAIRTKLGEVETGDAL